MHTYPYIIELLSPKRSPAEKVDSLLDRFAERYQRIMDSGCGVSIPDNPMGQPRLGALESIQLRSLPVDPQKVIMNLNTFHNKSVGRKSSGQADDYDPVANLNALHTHYPESCVYLSMLSFKHPWDELLPHVSP